MTTLTFTVVDTTSSDSPTIRVEANDPFIGFDNWTDLTAPNSPLISPAGLVDDSNGNLLLHDNKTPVLLLEGANWDTKVGKTGSAKCKLCEGVGEDGWQWTLTGRS